MGSLSGVGWLFSTSPNNFVLSSRKFPTIPRRTQSSFSRIPTTVPSMLRSASPVSELAEDDIRQTFFKERELSGDIIAKVSDMLWQRKAIKIKDAEVDVTEKSEQILGDENEGGFLKLTRTREWVAGDNSAPVNKKMVAKELQNDSERRKMLNLLGYEAVLNVLDIDTAPIFRVFVLHDLKRELMLLTVGIGTVCSGYCMVVLSVQAAMSYAAGVLSSCVYLQLLYKHVDNLSKEAVPQIFRQKKSKKIGIRSQDLKDLFERSIQGSGIALSSTRLVLPAAIYGFWGLSQHFASDLFDFQLLPAMVGLFAYKAAALVQVYRDNEELKLIFPESGEESSD